MGSGGMFAAVAVGLGGAYLLLRRSTPAPAPTGNNFCDSLPAGYPRDACNAASGVAGILGGLSKLLTGKSREEYKQDAQKTDAANSQLNGAPEVVASEVLTQCNSPERNLDHPPMHFTVFLPGQTLRFANGCVPFAGAPGSEKCKPGTKFFSSGWGFQQGVPADMMTGYQPGEKLKYAAFNIGDASTGYFNANAEVNAQKVCTGKFPLPIPPGGVAGFYRGKPFTCPQGTTPDFSARDHANGPVTAPRCLAPGQAPGIDRTGQTVVADRGGTDRTGQFSTPVNPNDPNFIFDPTCQCWRRRKAGE